MTRKARARRQRARTRDDAPASAGPPAARAPAPSRDADPMAVYRGLASPRLTMRWILVAGLGLFTAARVVDAAGSGSANADSAQALALGGVVCIALFLGSGFVRHYRALYRIRRDDPGAWQPTMGFALASLAVPLGFGGAPADDSERLVRRVTIVVLLAFVLTAILGTRSR